MSVVKEGRDDLFYLGFHKDTGELVQVIPPEGHELRVDPEKVKRISLGLLDVEEKEKILAQIELFNQLIKENSLVPRVLAFIDVPGHSPCGGSCGGIPFSWC
jgi:hypothetical protein